MANKQNAKTGSLERMVRGPSGLRVEKESGRKWLFSWGNQPVRIFFGDTEDAARSQFSEWYQRWIAIQKFEKAQKAKELALERRLGSPSAVLRTIPVNRIFWSGELSGDGSLDPGYPPIIVEEDVAGDYLLIDGSHRLGSAMASGLESIRAIVPNAAALAAGRFTDSIEEERWIEWVHRLAARTPNAPSSATRLS